MYATYEIYTYQSAVETLIKSNKKSSVYMAVKYIDDQTPVCPALIIINRKKVIIF